MKCESCGKEVSDKVKSFSLKKYNKVLCMDCQKKQQTEPKPTKEKNIETLALMKVGAILFSTAISNNPKVTYHKLMESLIKEYDLLRK